jgi:uncharacterized repeat protein (TIGR01451 family)
MAVRQGSAWSFALPAELAGQYTLWADAEDVAGNITTAGPFTVTVTCTDAAPVVTSLAAEPLSGQPMSLTLTVVISNAGPAPLPAGIPITVTEGATALGQMATTVPLAAGESQALSLAWAPSGTRDYDIGVTAGLNAVLPNGPLCVAPGTTRFAVSLRSATLDYGWNLITPPLNPGNTDVQVVQRGIVGDYTALLGYDGGLLAYYPDRPGDSTLATVDGRHGFWIHTPMPLPTDPPTDDPAATWWMAGTILPEDQPLSLAAGWNLASYLPRQPMTVTTALEGIADQYGAVLGFEGTAASSYPDLDSSYNTLAHVSPGYGYCISTTQAATLAYPVATITNTLSVTDTEPARQRLSAVREAEGQAGVQPSYEWMSFYGELALPDGTPAPTGTVVLAVDPDGVPCGATVVWQPGQFGLLACYGDDPATEADEGAVPGDVIDLYLSSDGTLPDGQFVGEGVWTALGARWQVEEGMLLLADLAITKAVMPLSALPGATITYTLAYSNAGSFMAQGVVISDRLPAEIEVTGFASSGAATTPVPGGQDLVWQVADLKPGEGGVITVTAIVSPLLTSALVLTNTAIITTPLEMWPGDNLAQAVLQVILGPPPFEPAARIWLPLIMRGEP